jgi:hypothetical protein
MNWSDAMAAFYGVTLGERTLRDPDRLIAALQGLWQPMDNAPLQGRVLLYRPTSPHFMRRRWSWAGTIPMRPPPGVRVLTGVTTYKP